MHTTTSLKIGVFGAGAIGTYVGGRLAAGGGDVVLVGRAWARDEAMAKGLHLTDLDGVFVSVAPDALRFATEASALSDRDVILCCVKSAGSAAAAAELGEVVGRDTVVISLQNGLRNAEVLRAGLPGQAVLAGIVGFNVVQGEGGAFRQGTSGPLVIEDSPDPRVRELCAALSRAGFLVERAADIRGQQWTKLLINLNNALGALTDAPTRELIFDARYRRIFVAVLDEAISVLRKGGIHPARLGAVPTRLFPIMLRLPTAILKVAIRAQLKIDPTARPSMWQDLKRGRTTEVEELNGEIVRLAASCGAAAPLNARIVEMVHEAEARGVGSPGFSAEALWGELVRKK